MRARAFFSPSSHLLRFSSRPLNTLFFSSLSSLPFFFFFFFFLFLRVCARVCSHTRDSVCSIFLLSYTRLHEALSSLFTSKFCHVYFRRRLSSPHRHSSTYCLSLCEPKVSCIYIYNIYSYIYVYYIYIYIYYV